MPATGMSPALTPAQLQPTLTPLLLHCCADARVQLRFYLLLFDDKIDYKRLLFLSGTVSDWDYVNRKAVSF